MAKIYGEVGGKVLEIQNWRDRASGDAVVMQRLSEPDAESFRSFRDRGLSDTQIFRALHPDADLEHGSAALALTPLQPEPEPAGDLSYRFDELPKAQLVWIIESVMGQRADSLANMERTDLLNLARFATKGRRVRLTFES